MRAFLLLCILSVSTLLAAGPFGLHKGMKLGQIDKNAVKIRENIYRVKVPTPNRDFDYYIVNVDPKLGLLKIIAVGKIIKTNDFGDQLRDEFEKYEHKLIVSYGKNLKFDYVKDDSIWNDSKYFMMGLEKEERVLSAYWSSENGSTLKNGIAQIGLKAVALGGSKGYLSLAYEFDGFEEYIDLLENKPDDTL